MQQEDEWIAKRDVRVSDGPANQYAMSVIVRVFKPAFVCGCFAFVIMDDVSLARPINRELFRIGLIGNRPLDLTNTSNWICMFDPQSNICRRTIYFTTWYIEDFDL